MPRDDMDFEFDFGGKAGAMEGGSVRAGDMIVYIDVIL